MKEDVKVQQAMQEQPKMTNTFSWRHIDYFVNVSGERRKLLDDISGYVAPGKLTALMESLELARYSVFERHDLRKMVDYFMDFRPLF